jgi:hypothetical protein
MRNATRQSNLIACETALEAAGMAIQLVLRVPAPLKSLADQVVRAASSVAATRAASGDPRMWAWGSKRVGGCPPSARRSGRVAAPMGREQSIGRPGPVRPGPDAALADRVRLRARGGVPPAAAGPCRSRGPTSGDDGPEPVRRGACDDLAAAASDGMTSSERPRGRPQARTRVGLRPRARRRPCCGAILPLPLLLPLLLSLALPLSLFLPPRHRRSLIVTARRNHPEDQQIAHARDRNHATTDALLTRE